MDADTRIVLDRHTQQIRTLERQVAKLMSVRQNAVAASGVLSKRDIELLDKRFDPE